MSTPDRSASQADSFRRPASYDRTAWSHPSDEAALGADPRSADEADGTRAFSPEELDDARGQGADDATTLLGSRGPRPAQGQAAARPQGTRPMERRQPQQGDAYQEPLYPARPSAQSRAQAPRADQTLVSPIAQERIRAEVHVPDPAYPPQRQRSREVPYGYGGEPAPAYRPRPQQVQQQPLRRRRQPRPQQPPLAQQGYGYQQPYQQQGYQPQFEAEEGPRHGHGLARGILLLVSWVLRLAAIGLVALVVVNCLTMGNRVAIMRVTALATQLLPRQLAGLYVLDSPLGGVFRGDFAIAAVILFVADWIVARIRRRLR